MIQSALIAVTALATVTAAAAQADPGYAVQTYAFTTDGNNAGTNFAGYNAQYQGGVIALGYFGSTSFASPGSPPSTTGTQSGTSSGNPYLTAASDTATTTRTDHGSTATAFASGDLASGALRASASGATYTNGYTYDVSGKAFAQFGDALTFDLPGATANSDTPITFTIRTDGSYGAYGPLGEVGASILAGLSVSQAGQATAQYFGGYTMSNAAPPVMNYNIQSNWVSSSITGTANDYTFQGVYNLHGINPTLTFGEVLQAIGYNGFADYSHTSQISLGLPTGASFTSASGVFLAGAPSVPEPATWALMLVGFGAIGFAMRRRPRVTVGFA